MTFRFLPPIRRMIPPVGGTLDLSPLILIVVLQLVLMMPVPWLEGLLLGLAGPWRRGGGARARLRSKPESARRLRGLHGHLDKTRRRSRSRSGSRALSRRGVRTSRYL